MTVRFQSIILFAWRRFIGLPNNINSMNGYDKNIEHMCVYRQMPCDLTLYSIYYITHFMCTVGYKYRPRYRVSHYIGVYRGNKTFIVSVR